MADLTLRLVKGSTLTHQEVDDNFSNINNEVQEELFAGTEGGFWPDVDATATIFRLRDRVFINEGGAFTGNRAGTQEGFVPTATEGANWAPRDSSLFVAQDTGLMAVTGFVSNENIDTTPGEPTQCIGVSGFAIGNKASRSAWGLYSDVQFEAGSYGYGIEIAVKNKSADETSTPYFATTGTYGVWLPGGGDDAYGGSPTHPNNTAIAIGSNSSTWNSGVVFFEDGLTRDGSGYARAMLMAEKQMLAWYMTGNYPTFYLYSDITATGHLTQLAAKDTGLFLIGNNSKSAFVMQVDPDGVNFAGTKNATTGNPAEFFSSGDDTDVDLKFTPKGSGVMRFGTHSALAAETVSGYITIKDAAGNVRKLAVVS